MEKCRVQVREGVLEGKLCSSYNGKPFYSFEGIPYAKPPTGELRFRAPEPPEPWQGIRDATKPGNISAQINLAKPDQIVGSEDCLYLNIYTPRNPREKAKKLPVIFFKHGGKYLLGYGHYYKPDYFLDQDVVFVNINYRLGVLGFLALDTPEVPGNAGLKDAVAALKWIKSNIESFGGDSDNITVFGESSGASSITGFLVSDMTKGLFNKVISASVVCNSVYLFQRNYLNNAVELATLLGHEYESKEKLYKFLLKASVDDLCKANALMERLHAEGELTSKFSAVIEKEFPGVQAFFKEEPIVAIKEGRMVNVPILLGLSSYEGAYFAEVNADGNLKYQDLRYFPAKFLGIDKDSPKARLLGDKVTKYYIGDDDNNESRKEKYLQCTSDGFFARDMSIFVELACRRNPQVFFYRFDYDGDISMKIMKRLRIKGSTHCGILPFLFYRGNKHKMASDSDRRVIRFLAESLCSFAGNGKPTWTNQTVVWSPYDAKNKLVLNISDDLALIRSPYADRTNFWLSLKAVSKL